MRTFWLDCALATALVVGTAILVTGPAAPVARPPLSEQEVRTYVEIGRQVTEVLGDLAVELQLARGGNVDGTGFRIEWQDRVDAVLGRHGLTHETWDVLRRRVEAATGR